MYKEMIISIILVILIFVGEFVTQNYTKKGIDSIKDELQQLKLSLNNNNEEDAKEQVEEVYNNWEQKNKRLSFYIEHEELEEVETNLTVCRSFTQTGNYDLAISELERTVFVLEHIVDKYSFNLQNIF